MKAFDVDVQIASFAMPFVLPNDFTLSIGHTRPISFRTKNIITILTLKRDVPKLRFRMDIFNVTVGQVTHLQTVILLSNNSFQVWVQMRGRHTTISLKRLWKIVGT